MDQEQLNNHRRATEDGNVYARYSRQKADELIGLGHDLRGSQEATDDHTDQKTDQKA